MQTDRLRRHLGLDEGMSSQVAGRMLTLAAEYTADALAAFGSASEPGLDTLALVRLAQHATRAETHLQALLEMAEQNCADWPVVEVPVTIRSHLSTAARCRSVVCGQAIGAGGTVTS